MPIILFSLTIIFSFNFVHATNCPTAPPAYREMLNRLDQFVTQVQKNQSSDCNPLGTQLSDLKLFYEKGTKFRDVLERAAHIPEKDPTTGKVPELTTDQIKDITDYSKAAAEKISTIVGSLSQLYSNQCLDSESEKSTLATLSEITGEVTRVAATYSGPYGILVSVGGSAIAGVLQSVDALIQKRKFGYDFEKDTDRRLYGALLCSYHDIRNEIDSLVAPESKVSELVKVCDALSKQEEKIVSECPECKKYSEYLANSTNQNKDLKALKENNEALIARLPGEGPRMVCVAYAEIFHSDTSVLKKQVASLPVVGSDAVNNAVKAYQMVTSAQGIPTPVECFNLGQYTEADLSNRVKYAHDILTFIIQSLTLINGTANAPVSTDESISAKIKLLEHNRVTRIWVDKELKEFQGYSESAGANPAKDALMDRYTFLEQRMMKDLAPRILWYYYKKSSDKIWEYTKFKDGFQTQFFGPFKDVMSGIDDGLPYEENITKILARLPEDVGVMSVLAGGAATINDFGKAFLGFMTPVQAWGVYCKYFMSTGYWTSDISQACSLKTLESGIDVKKLDHIVSDWLALNRYSKACQELGIIDKSQLAKLEQAINSNEGLGGGDGKAAYDPNTDVYDITGHDFLQFLYLRFATTPN